MKQAEIYNGHAGRFHRMANHIELSMMPQHLQRHGGPIQSRQRHHARNHADELSLWMPAGKKAVLDLSAGMIPGEERSHTVRGLFMMTAECSEYDQTVKYTILHFQTGRWKQQNSQSSRSIQSRTR